MKVRTNLRFKSIAAGLEFELPDFCVITGRNGSGKSHLLEIMTRSDMSEIHGNDGPLTRSQFVGFGALSPQIDEVCEPQNLAQLAKGWWSQIDSVQQQVRNLAQNNHVHADPVRSIMGNSYGQDSQIVRITKSVMLRTKKDFASLTEDDVNRYSTFADGDQSTLFASQLATVFKSYSNKKIKNSFNKFLNEQSGSSIPVFTDVEFVEKFGPKPWDLVNDILNRAGLSYRVISPEGQDPESAYRLRLVDESKSLEISANDLSTGEKVLMSLAVAIYNTHESVGKPDVLMLDEPDAPLHPRYSKLLMESLREVVAKRAGVCVVMTTHSPSTVAMCRDNELFEMDRDVGYPQMISISKGLEVLTFGIPHLKISIENRRQIFVESKYDVVYYQALYNSVHRLRPFSYEPVFLEPHSGTSNCADVNNIVKGLHVAGVDLVRGIVDWDLSRTSLHPVYVLGQDRRYSIENYILDPIYVALALIRERRWTFDTCGCSGLHSYVSARDMTFNDAQSMVAKVMNACGIAMEDLLDCELMNGWSVHLPRGFVHMRGHDWEELLLVSIPALNEVVVRGRGDAGLKLGVLKVIEEFPQYLSVDIWATLERVA